MSDRFDEAVEAITHEQYSALEVEPDASLAYTRIKAGILTADPPNFITRRAAAKERFARIAALARLGWLAIEKEESREAWNHVAALYDATAGASTPAWEDLNPPQREKAVAKVRKAVEAFIGMHV